MTQRRWPAVIAWVWLVVVMNPALQVIFTTAYFVRFLLNPSFTLALSYLIQIGISEVYWHNRREYLRWYTKHYQTKRVMQLPTLRDTLDLLAYPLLTFIVWLHNERLPFPTTLPKTPPSEEPPHE
jgi:hypothetical protein